MTTTLKLNSASDIAKLFERLIQEPGIVANVSLTHDEFWLVVIAGASSDHVKRCAEDVEIQCEHIPQF